MVFLEEHGRKWSNPYYSVQYNPKIMIIILIFYKYIFRMSENTKSTKRMF